MATIRCQRQGCRVSPSGLDRVAKREVQADMTAGDISPERPTGGAFQASVDAAGLMRAARWASLATLDRATGHPYVSLVTVALDQDGQPLMLLSRLARHTQNLAADPRASLLFAPAGQSASDPLAGARVTVMGAASPTPSPTAPARFLGRHPQAQMYAAFADFGYFALALDHAHFIGGFGRIIDIPAEELRAAIVSADV